MGIRNEKRLAEITNQLSQPLFSLCILRLCGSLMRKFGINSIPYQVRTTLPDLSSDFLSSPS